MTYALIRSCSEVNICINVLQHLRIFIFFHFLFNIICWAVIMFKKDRTVLSFTLSICSHGAWQSAATLLVMLYSAYLGPDVDHRHADYHATLISAFRHLAFRASPFHLAFWSPAFDIPDPHNVELREVIIKIRK